MRYHNQKSVKYQTDTLTVEKSQSQVTCLKSIYPPKCNLQKCNQPKQAYKTKLIGAC